jgi:hypothetical protein
MWTPSQPSIQVTTNPREAKDLIAPTIPNTFSTTWIKPNYIDLQDNFGQCVVVAGRYMAVGAPGEDSNATLIGGDETNNSASSAGCVRIYYLNPATSAWEYQAYLKKDSSLSGNNAFGQTIAFNEDGSRLFVGNTTSNAGAQKVQVFQRTGVSTWAFLVNIEPTSPTSDASDNFGNNCIVAYGDVVAVGAVLEDGSGTGVNPAANNSTGSVGCVYVFRWNGSAYVQEAYIKPQTATPGLQFGGKLALHGTTLVVGLNSGLPGSGGFVEVFDFDGANWAYTTTLTSSNIESGDNFGSGTGPNSVSIYGDFICVGAYAEDGSGTGINPANNNSGNAAGAAYLFKRTSGVWAQTAYFKGANTGAGDNFGVALQIYDGKIIVGASNEDGSGTGLNPASNDSTSNSGAYYLFTYDEITGIPTQIYYIKNVFTPVASNTLVSGFEISNGTSSVALGDNIVAIGFQREDSDSTITGIQYPTPNVLGSNTGAVFVYNI